MPRSRTKSTSTPASDTTETQETTTTTSNTNTGGTKMAGDMDKINKLRGKTRTRGAGGVELKEFLASGEEAVEVSLTTGRFANKTAKQVQTSLNNAKKSSNANGLVFPDAQDVTVIVESAKESDDGAEHVYLVR